MLDRQRQRRTDDSGSRRRNARRFARAGSARRQSRDDDALVRLDARPEAERVVVNAGGGRHVCRRRSRSIGIARDIDDNLHDSVAGPLTCGAVRPAVMLSPDVLQWPSPDIRRAIVHELEHVRRHYWLVHSVARAIGALYWFHPLVWACWRSLCLEAERSCDDAVIRQEDATDYAEQLITLAERLTHHRHRPVLAMASRGDLSARIGALLDPTRRRDGVAAATVAAVVALALSAAGAAAPFRLVAVVEAQTTSETRIGDATAASPAFEVVSVKPNEVVGESGVITGPAASPFRVVNVTLHAIIRYAYDLRDSQLLDSPDWTRAERFDITATYPTTATRSADGARLMLQRALAERFGLRVRRERRELPVYRLVTARGDGRLGRLLVRSDVDCVQWLADKKSQFIGTPPIRPGGARPACLIVAQRNYIVAGTKPVADLARALESIVSRPVIDATGLAGNFDIELQWTSAPGLDPGSTTSSDSDVTVFTALQEQLGLKLEPGRAPVDTLVVESVSRPTPN
jgi:uncharacterized protein (TIGR03435 family)